MSDTAVLAILWVFLALCALFVWTVARVTVAFTRWVQAPKTPRPERPPRVDPKKEEEEKEARRRRSEAIAAAEVVFSTHAFDIRERFGRADFDTFVLKFMGEDREPGYVEARSRELQGVIRRHVRAVEPDTPLTVAEQVAAARRDVERYYHAHARFLRDSFSPARLQAELRVRIPDDSSEQQVWEEARRIIRHLEPLVRQGAQARRRQEERLRQIDHQIEDLQREIADTRSGVEGAPEELDDDVDAKQRRLRELEREREAILFHLQ